MTDESASASERRAISASDRALSAADRLTEVQTRLARLKRREPSTQQDVQRARERALAQSRALKTAQDRLLVMYRSVGERQEERARALARGELAGSISPHLTEENARLRQGLIALLSWAGGADPDEIDRRQEWCQAITEQCGEPGWRNWMTAVCLAGVTVLPSVRAIGVTVMSELGVVLAAASDDWAAKVQELEWLIGEGPSLTAYDSGRAVVVTDFATETEQWPGYAAASSTQQPRGIWAVPLCIHGLCVGTITLYFPASVPPSAELDLADANAFAEIAATALLADLEQACRGGPGRAEQFIVHIATGVLAARLQIQPDDAESWLRASAFSNDLPLVEMARRVIEDETAGAG